MSERTTRVAGLALLPLLAACVLCGCAARRPVPTAGPDDAMAATAASPRIPNAPRTAEENLERLTRLHAERSVEMKDEQYVLGTGDVLAIRAFEVEELDRRVRVDHDRTVTLPLLGTVPAAGLTVSALQQELTRRLGEYMYNPHVAVFVEEYRSHQVAVVGSVRTPGLITLRDRELTVLDALSAAGGMNDAAAGQIFLIPSEGREGLAAALTGMLADSGLRSDGRDLIAGDGRVANDDGAFRKAQPIMIDVNRVPDGVETFFFSLPVRDGDVILVRPAGHFILTGWVHKPGTYPLRPGLTLRGALATGGGLRFAAKKTRISIHRLSPRGGREVETIDFKAISAQKAEDIFIDEGDVIEVSSSVVKLVPYGFYALVADVVRFGAGIRMVP